VLPLCQLLGAALLAAQPTAAVSGTVFADRNANGRRDPGEPGVAGVAVSNQVDVARTDAAGRYTLAGPGHGVVFVSVPDGWRARGRFWRAAPAPGGAPADSLDFALERAPRVEAFTFVHASDTHLDSASLPRTTRLRALVDSIRPALVLISGDLVRDALRVSEERALANYRLFERERARFGAPVWTVPGNHELLGINGTASLIPREHPLRGRGLYRAFFGPDYYSFTYGGVHFVGLNTADDDGDQYFGHVDSTQLAWLARDLAAVPAGTPVVTFDHIPLVSAAEPLGGYTDAPPAPTLARVGERTVFRHVVSNTADVLRAVHGHPYPLALGGHIHFREVITYAPGAGGTRFEQAAAVVGPSPQGGMAHPSGIAVYRVRAGRIDAGTFVPLDSTERR
jgi:hypothetical protein